MDRPRKAPAVERAAAAVNEDDLLVRVLGTVKKLSEDGFLLSDETGDIEVQTEDKATAGDRVRVFGRPTKAGRSLVLSADLVQQANGLNENIYKKIKTEGL